jgi:predicted nucleotidyltransferase
MATLDFMMSRRLQRLLGALYLDSGRSFSLSDLIRIGGAGRGATQNAVEGLLEAGLVQDRRIGNQRLFTVNVSHPLYPDLRSIALKSFGLADRLRDALASFGEAIEEAFVFGSIVKGSEKASSDIDLIAIGTADLFDVDRALEDAERDLGRPIHVNLYAPQEWARLQKDPVLAAIVTGPKIMVVERGSGRND